MTDGKYIRAANLNKKKKKTAINLNPELKA